MRRITTPKGIRGKLCYVRLKPLTFSPFLFSNQAKVGNGPRVWYGSGTMTPSNATGQPGVIHIEDTATKEELATPWNVIVHNDPINLMNYVTMVLMRVFGYPRAKAKKMMLEVHNQGRSLVWSGGREQAEHYVHQLHGYQLLATMEKSET
jgi:ATP-dependent Clp protease adaptor protein ClpS